MNIIYGILERDNPIEFEVYIINMHCNGLIEYQDLADAFMLYAKEKCKHWFALYHHRLKANLAIHTCDSDLFMEAIQDNLFTTNDFYAILYTLWELRFHICKANDYRSMIYSIHTIVTEPIIIPSRCAYHNDLILYSHILEERKQRCHKAVSTFMFNNVLEKDLNVLIAKELLDTQTNECWAFNSDDFKKNLRRIGVTIVFLIALFLLLR